MIFDMTYRNQCDSLRTAETHHKDAPLVHDPVLERDGDRIILSHDLLHPCSGKVLPKLVEGARYGPIGRVKRPLGALAVSQHLSIVRAGASAGTPGSRTRCR